MENNNIKTIAIGKFKDHNFFVDEYQRGYKWGVQQVLDLLKDISSFDKSKEVFYSLQPLAVKLRKWISNEQEINGYEVIDGQQRLTTVFIILKVFKEELYSLQYQTRLKSAQFLNQIEKIIKNDFSIEFEDNVNKLTKSLNGEWAKFLTVDGNNGYDNIDIYHFFGAYVLIKAWFDKNNETRDSFEKKLLSHTRFIWYEDESNDSSKQVFRNLNSGKIPLTNAELIKALFINKFKNINKEIQELQQNNFAGEWDSIEQDLYDDKFWFFINNDTNKTRYQTRIDFLFEIIIGKQKKESKDNLYTYRQYANNNKELNWNKVKELFLQLKEWFEDRQIYHLVGYIIDRNFSKIKDLVELSNKDDITKSEFYKKLISIVKTRLNLYKEEQTDLDSIETINFEDNKNDINNILLLFNIEQYQSRITGFRFPFNKFKNTKWTIEHIHAQNANDFKTVKEIEAWLSELKNIITDFNENDSKNEGLSNKIKELRDIINKQKNEDAEKLSDELNIKLKDTIELTSEILNVHKINNLALLDGSTNSGLGNKPFPEKREYILNIDKSTSQDKAFIPLVTLNIFQKHYTKGVSQYDFWGYKDREDYIETIKMTLEKYLLIEKKETKNEQ